MKADKEGLLNPDTVAALGAWLKQNDIAPARFAVSNGLDPSDLYRLLDGKKDRISVAQAWKIQKGTRGEIKMQMWLPNEKTKASQ